MIAQEAGCWINDFFASKTALTKGNPIYCCAPGIAPVFRKLMGVG